MAFTGNVFTGARAKLLVGSEVVGYATNISGSQEIQWEAIRTLDNAYVTEFAPLGYECSASASRVRLVKSPIRGGPSTGAPQLFPKHGQTSSDFLLNINNLFAQMSMSILDSIAGSNVTVALLEQLVVVRHNWTVGARSVMGEDIDMLAVKMKDESEI